MGGETKTGLKSPGTPSIWNEPRQKRSDLIGKANRAMLRRLEWLVWAHWRDDPHQSAVRSVVANRIKHHVRLRLIVAGHAAAVREVPVQNHLLYPCISDQILADRIRPAIRGGQIDHLRRQKRPSGAGQAVLWRMNRLPRPLGRKVADEQRDRSLHGLSGRSQLRVHPIQKTSITQHSERLAIQRKLLRSPAVDRRRQKRQGRRWWNAVSVPTQVQRSESRGEQNDNHPEL